MKKIYSLVIAVGILYASVMSAMQRGQLSSERRQQLQEQLENSAFRRGISTGIQGTMKIAPSDHSPIMVKYDDIAIVSWNLLSDEHLDNFLLDIGEKKHFDMYKRDGKAIAWRDVFNDFGHFVLDNSLVDKFGVHKINITAALMNEFITHEKNKKRSDNLIKDAESFVALVLDDTNPNHADIKMSLVHVMEIVFSMDQGYLQWKERFKKITENRFLVTSLAAHDFLCFQECTNPRDMLNLVRQNSNRDFDMIVHHVKSKDNCVIIYDKNRYELKKHRNFALGGNKKPGIVAEFRSKDADESLIIGSIHHAGRGKSEMHLILEQVNHLLQGASDTPIMVLGDYNHQSSFFTQDLINTDFALKMPSKPTMAGIEYGNMNKAIDGVFTNRPTKTTVNVLEQRAFASQVVLPMEIKFEI